MFLIFNSRHTLSAFVVWVLLPAFKHVSSCGHNQLGVFDGESMSLFAVCSFSGFFVSLWSQKLPCQCGTLGVLTNCCVFACGSSISDCGTNFILFISSLMISSPLHAMCQVGLATLQWKCFHLSHPCCCVDSLQEDLSGEVVCHAVQLFRLGKFVSVGNLILVACAWVAAMLRRMMERGKTTTVSNDILGLCLSLHWKNDTVMMNWEHCEFSQD